VTLEHVKIGDIAEVVGQLEAAKAVGKDSDGNVDLMWVNGENFAAMKNGELIWGAFADKLPNAETLKDSESIKMDFSVPVLPSHPHLLTVCSSFSKQMVALPIRHRRRFTVQR